MQTLQRSGKDRAVAAAAAAAIELALAAVLFFGLTVNFRQTAERLPTLVTIGLPTPTPSPTPTPAAAPQGEAAPPGREAQAAPTAAPPARIELAPPRPAATVAGEGEEASSGAAQAGSGPGAGGTGSGIGAGGAGGGTGSGFARPPVRIAGELRDRDYPREAERVGAEGTVTIGFRVRTDGHVDRCSIVRSSGYELLDSLTCQLLERRFRFRPALDASGQPADAVLRTSFTWGIRRRR